KRVRATVSSATCLSSATTLLRSDSGKRFWIRACKVLTVSTILSGSSRRYFGVASPIASPERRDCAREDQVNRRESTSNELRQNLCYPGGGLKGAKTKR